MRITKITMVLMIIMNLSIHFASAKGVEIEIKKKWVGNAWGNETGSFDITNTTSFQMQIDGIRFNIPGSPKTLTDQSGSFESAKPINDGNGVGRIEVRTKKISGGIANQNLPMNIFNPSKTSTYSMSTTEIDSGVDWTPFSPQFLIKTGSLASKKVNKDIDGITLKQLDSISKLSFFYDENLFVLDTLGIHGSAWGAGFIDTWYDQDKNEPIWQIQVGIPPMVDSSVSPADTFKYWNGAVQFDPDSMDTRDDVYGAGPLYMMGAAIGQEYMNIDMQYLLATGFQESKAGLRGYTIGGQMVDDKWVSELIPDKNSYPPNGIAYYNHKQNNDQQRGPLHFIESSYKTYVYEAYPKYFPFDTKYEKSPKYITTTQTGGCELNSPQIGNAYLLSSLYMWYTWQLVVAKLGKDGLDFYKNASNREISAQMVSWAWNKGFNGAFATFVQNPDGAKNIDKDIDYVGFVWNGINHLENANRKSTVAGGTARIYDGNIALKDLEKLFFGEGGNPGTGKLGTAGILHHYKLTDAKRTILWGEVDSAFNMLKGRAPSVNGKDLISYRYDYLAILRIAKKFLDLSIPVPKGEEFKNWIKETKIDSTDPSFDSKYPYLVQGSKSSDGNNNFLMSVNVKDNLCLPISDVSYNVVEWSIDTNWLDWHSAEFVFGDSLSAVFRIKVDASIIKNNFGGKTGFGWIRVTDRNFNSTVDTFSIAGVTYPYLKDAYIEDSDGDGKGDKITIELIKGKADKAEDLTEYQNLKYSWPNKTGLISANSNSVSVSSSKIIINDNSLLSGDGEGLVTFNYITNPNDYSGFIIDKVGAVIIKNGANYTKPTDPSLQDIIFISFSEAIKDALLNNKIYLVFYDKDGKSKEVAATIVEKIDNQNYKFTFPPGTLKDQKKVNLKTDTELVDLKGNKVADNNQKVDIEVTEANKLWLKASPVDGTKFGSSLKIVLTTNGTKIYYSTNGSNPDLTTANIYNGEFTITGNSSINSITVTAIATADGFISDTGSWTYEIQALSKLIISPEGKEFTDSLEVSIALKDAWKGSSIYFTLDGSDPDTSSKSTFLYDNNKKIMITEATTIKAQAFVTNALPSNIAEEKYTKKIIIKEIIDTASSAAYFDTDGNGGIDQVQVRFKSVPKIFPEKIIFTNPFDNDKKTINALNMKWLNDNPATKIGVLTVEFDYSGKTFWETTKLGKVDSKNFDNNSFNIFDQVAPVIDSAFYFPGAIIDTKTLERAKDTMRVSFSEKISNSSFKEEPFILYKNGNDNNNYSFKLKYFKKSSNKQVLSFFVNSISDKNYYPTSSDKISIDVSAIFNDVNGAVQTITKNRKAPLIVVPKPYKLDIKTLIPISSDNKHPLSIIDFMTDLTTSGAKGNLNCEVTIFDVVGNTITTGSENEKSENIKIELKTENSRSRYDVFWNTKNDNGRFVSSNSYLMVLVITPPNKNEKQIVENIIIMVKNNAE